MPRPRAAPPAGTSATPDAAATARRADRPLAPGAGITQYLQLASVLRHRIAQGEFVAGGQLPTVAQLAEQYRLARITVRQAYGVLIAEGLITSQRGRGTFVVPQQPSPQAQGSRLRSAINDPGTQDLRFDILEQRSRVVLPEQLARGQPTCPHYHFIRKIHVLDGEPFCLAEIYVASEIHAKFPPGSEQQHKIAWLAGTYARKRLQRVQQTMTVAPADLVLARQLGCGFATPVAQLARRIFDGADRLALAGMFWYRGDRFVADIEIPFDIWLNYPGVVIPRSRAADVTR
ncbi:GntR family transcriptional regulator [Comamonadaceae bacterium G21597-S1]|nr:GntR family transcriptional regulator [Comamonadaceae bacterium G21597-S1]